MYAHVRLILEKDFCTEIKPIYNYYHSVLITYNLLDIIIIIIIACAAIVSDTRDR